MSAAELLHSASSRSRRRAREREAGLRRPLVLGATRAALEQADRLMPTGRIMEVEIGRAIEAGALRIDDGGALVTLADLHLEARVIRTRSRITGRKAWQPISLSPARKPHRPRKGNP